MNKFLKFLFTPYYGSNRVSRFLRCKIERLHSLEFIGIPLVALTFLGAIVVPQTQAGFDTTAVYLDTQQTAVEATVTPSRFRWPLSTFGLSQSFHYGHPGLDLTNPAGTPIFPVTEGNVILVSLQYQGYGRHIIVQHDDHMTSTYAHLSKTEVTEGQHVTKDTELGTVGSTGWSTGNHLHLEVYQNGTAINPMEVLPEIRKYEPNEISHAAGSESLPGLSL